jgi:predicted amidohydrolase YtcJ
MDKAEARRDISAIIGDRVFDQAPGLHALELEGPRISAIRRLSEVELDSYKAARGGAVLDARGQWVLPGLIDSHVHAIPTGMIMLIGDVREVRSLPELEAAIKAEAAKGTQVVRLGGLDRSRLTDAERAMLTREWLDALVSDRPMFVKSVEGHSSWFNSLGWEHFGVGPMLCKCELSTEEQQQMYSAGRVHGGAYEELTEPIYDSFSFEERREGMQRVLKLAAARGLTGIHCLEGYGAHRKHDFSMMLELDGQGCELTCYCRDATPEVAAELGIRRFGGCWCVDGAIGSHSAALNEPYADQPHSLGELYFSDSELTSWIESGLSGGMQVCNHVIGDRAIEQALRVYESLAPRHDLQAIRPRIDHFILGTPEHARQAAALGLCSSMQPAFDAFWGGDSSGYAMRLGPERALRSNPVGMALREGMHIAGSSDSYITPLDPLLGIRAAMQHHNPAYRVDRDTAIRLFSEHGAWLAHDEDRVGKLAVGYRADVTIVKGEPGDEGAEVTATVFAGEQVFG